MQGVSYYHLLFSCNMQFLGSRSHFLDQNEYSFTLQIPLKKLVLHGQSTLCQKEEYTRLHNLGDILQLASYVHNCKFLIVISVYFLTDLGFWITVDATGIIIIRLWSISVKEKTNKNQLKNKVKIKESTI